MDEEAKDGAPKTIKTRPWWLWPLSGLVTITLGLFALFVLKACDGTPIVVSADASPDAPSGSAAFGNVSRVDDGTSASVDDVDDVSGADDGETDVGVEIDVGADVATMGVDADVRARGEDASAVMTLGPGVVHRRHTSDEAQHWRVTAGAHKVSRTEEGEGRFDVWLAPGQSFEGVSVEWQDKDGTWHVH